MEKAAVKEGFPITALRETNVLLMLRHPNIISVREMVVGREMDKVYMVMDYMDHDLKTMMTLMPQSFSQAEIKCLLLQLLSGTAYMHENWIVHRDMKTSNLLMNHEGRLCICDFGLARKYGSPLQPYTHNVVTLWYRAPELLLIGTDALTSAYTPAVDVWSVGCIFAEMLTKKPLLPGKTEGEQLDLIFKLCGTPTEATWPGWSSLPAVAGMHIRSRPPANLRQAMGLGMTGYGGAPFLSDAGVELLRSMLTLNPAARISAADALRHRFFTESPPPADPRLLPTIPNAREKDVLAAHARTKSPARIVVPAQQADGQDSA